MIQQNSVPTGSARQEETISSERANDSNTDTPGNLGQQTGVLEFFPLLNGGDDARSDAENEHAVLPESTVEQQAASGEHLEHTISDAVNRSLPGDLRLSLENASPTVLLSQMLQFGVRLVFSIFSLLVSLLRRLPVVRTLFRIDYRELASRLAVRLIITQLVVWLIWAVAALLFFLWYLSKARHNSYELPIYFNYTRSSPDAIVNAPPLDPGKTYHYSVRLLASACPANVELGNLVVEFSMVDSGGTLLLQAARPFAMGYWTSIAALLRSALYAIPEVLGLVHEQSPVIVGVAEEFNVKQAGSVPVAYGLQLSDRHFVTHGAYLLIHADQGRFTRFVVTHPVVSCLAFPAWISLCAWWIVVCVQAVAYLRQVLDGRMDGQSESVMPDTERVESVESTEDGGEALQ